MQALPKLRSLLILKNSVIQSTVFASTLKTHLVAFHSTPVTHNKWRNKWAFDQNNWTHETPPETETLSDVDEEHPPSKKDRSKSSHAARRAAQADHKRMKRKLRRDKMRRRLENDDQENVFQESVGNRGHTWSYWSFGEASYQAGFDSKKRSSGKHKRLAESDMESDAEPKRQILGLPLRGPLNIQDVKNAFRLSALKWHPDKHQGSSQAVAADKFKLCVDAYESLCKSLSAAA